MAWKYLVICGKLFNFAPHYNIRQDDENNYHATVENLTGGQGKMILVRKQWVDDNDTLHREPVKFKVYGEDGNELDAKPLSVGEGGVWQVQVYITGEGITQETPVYVREIQPEDVEGAEKPGEAIDGGGPAVHRHPGRQPFWLPVGPGGALLPGEGLNHR